MALTRFLDDGVIPIDNGVVERLPVRTALTRISRRIRLADIPALMPVAWSRARPPR